MEFNNSTPGKRREGSAGGMDLSISGSMLAYRSNNCSQYASAAIALLQTTMAAAGVTWTHCGNVSLCGQALDWNDDTVSILTLFDSEGQNVY